MPFVVARRGSVDSVDFTFTLLTSFCLIADKLIVQILLIIVPMRRFGDSKPLIRSRE